MVQWILPFRLWEFTPTFGQTPQPQRIWRILAREPTPSPYRCQWLQDRKQCCGDFFALTLTSTTVPDTCGQGFGSIDLSVSNGQSPYTYSWSNGETTEDLNNLLSGTYTVTVTDANGETATRMCIVQDIMLQLFTKAFAQDNHGCNGNFDGSAIAVPNPPNPDYTYLWSTGETTVTINSLPPGIYTVTVTLGTCITVASAIVDDLPTYPILSTSIIKTTCGLSNGSIDLTAHGPNTPFTYLWSNGETTEDLVDLLAGTYAVTVTGDNGCTAVSNVIVPNTNPPINLNGVVVSNTSCFSQNGSINLSTTPAGAYTYDWSTGDITEDLANLFTRHLHRHGKQRWYLHGHRHFRGVG